MKGIMVAVGAVIENDEGQVLLVKHRPEREHLEGEVDLPRREAGDRGEH